MKTLKKYFDFKGLFFFIISFGCLLLLLYILYNEITILRQNLSHEEQKIELKDKESHSNKQNAIQDTHTSLKKEVKEDVQEKKINIKVATFQNRKNVNRIISILKKEKFEYKIVGKGPYKVYVFAKNEKEKDKIFSLLKSKNVKPIVVKDVDG